MYQEEPDGIFGIIEVVRDFYDHGIDETYNCISLDGHRCSRYHSGGI